MSPNRVLRSKVFALLILNLAGATAAWAQPPGFPPPAFEPKSQISIDDFASLRQLVTPGFEELPLDRKLFAYWLMQAMEAGRDIAWTQVSRSGLDIRHLLEAIWQKEALLTGKEKAAITRYYFSLLASHGPYRLRSNRKFVCEGLTQTEFRAMLLRIQIPLPTPNLQQAIFDPEYEKYRIAPTGSDALANSGVNFYGLGMTQEKLDALPEPLRNHPLSYPEIDRASGLPSLTLQKIGSRFHTELSAVSFFLDRAKPYATEAEKAILTAYQKSWATGSPDDLKAAEILWARHKPTDLGFTIGFIETYDDPLGARGTWQGTIFLMNPSAVAKARSEKIRAAARFFENKMPVDEAFKKTGNGNPPNSEGAFLLYFSGGDNGHYFDGINLPNDPEIHKVYGSNSFTFYNKIYAVGATTDQQFNPKELSALYRPEYHALLRSFKVSDFSAYHIEFHEILGHGSGQDLAGVQSKEAFGGDYDALEETRAEVAALYHATDGAALIEKGILPADWDLEKAQQFSRFGILYFFTSSLRGLMDILGSPAIRQAHQLGHHMIFNFLVREGALTIELSDQNVPRIKLSSLEQMRASLGRFWGIIQKTKSTGDHASLKSLISDLGAFTSENERWAKAIKEQLAGQTKPRNAIYLSPEFQLIPSEEGPPLDIRLNYIADGSPIEAAILRETQRIKLGAERCLILLSPTAL